MPTAERYARYREDQTTIWVSKTAADFIARERTSPGEGAAAALDRILNEYRKLRRAGGGGGAAGGAGGGATKGAAKGATKSAGGAKKAAAGTRGTRATRGAAKGGAKAGRKA